MNRIIKSTKLALLDEMLIVNHLSSHYGRQTDRERDETDLARHP